MKFGIETLESRRLLSGAGGVLGEYHGVLQFGNLPAGVVPGVGGAETGGAFSTHVILTLNTLSKNGRVTGTLKAGKLGDFNVTGSTRGGRLSLVLNDNDSTAHTLAVSSAKFTAPIRSDGNLRGNLVETINSDTVTGSMRLRFLKDLATSAPAAASAASGLSTQATTQTGTSSITDTTQTALGASTLDISGTNPMGSSGSLDISGTTLTAPLRGTPDISGTTPGAFTGAPDISGSNSNNGLGGVSASTFESMFGASVFFG